MASGGDPAAPPVDEELTSLDIDNIHILLQVEHEQVQKRTFTNWMNAQLSKRSSPSLVQDLFADLRDGVRLLDLLEVMSDQSMKREKGHGVFQQRGNIERALNFLKNKSIKLVNINVSDIIEGNPSIILGLIWTIILRCHIEELASTLSFGSRSSSLESLSSQDSALGTPVQGSPLPHRASPLHKRFRLSAKKALLLWVRDQCRKVGCSLAVRDFKSSWRSGVAFQAILCSLRPDLVDLSITESRSNLENLDEAFRIAQQELGIPRLLEPEDVDVDEPDEKSIMTYVAQFLQYSNDLPSVEDELELRSLLSPTCLSPVNLPAHFTPAVLASPLHEGSPSQKVKEMTYWLEGAHAELLDLWTSTEDEGYAARYQAFQAFAGSFGEQRRPVLPMLSAMKRCTKLSEEQLALRKAWDTVEERLRQCRTDLDAALPAPLHTLVQWLQRVEAVLCEEHDEAGEHATAARDARQKQEQLEALLEDMGGHLDTLSMFHNTADDGSSQVPVEKLDELKRRFTSARVVAKYYGIKLEYREQWHNVCELLNRLKSRLSTWRRPYGSQESVLSLLQDWDDTINKQGLVSTLNTALHKLKETASTYTSKAALADDVKAVSRQVKDVESEVGVSTGAAAALRDDLLRVLAAWESYRNSSNALQPVLGRAASTTGEEASCSASEWISCHTQLNDAGSFLMQATDGSTSRSLADELGTLNMKWAVFVKKTKCAVLPLQPVTRAPQAHVAHSLLQEAGWVLREPVDVSSAALRSFRARLQVMEKKISEVDLECLSVSPGFSEEVVQNLKRMLPEMKQALSTAERMCAGLQKGVSQLEGSLAELSHWSTGALDVCKRTGPQEPRSRIRTLISRGLQLETQVTAQTQDFQAMLADVQRGSSLTCLSFSALKDRVKDTITHSQEITGMLSCVDVKPETEAEGGQLPPRVIVRAYTTPEPQTGTFQKYEAQISNVGTPSQETPTQFQVHRSPVQQRMKAKHAIQPRVICLDGHPDGARTAVRSDEVQLLQTPVLISCTVEKEAAKKDEAEDEAGRPVEVQSPQSAVSQNTRATSRQQHTATRSKSKSRPEAPSSPVATPSCLHSSPQYATAVVEAQATEKRAQMGLKALGPGTRHRALDKDQAPSTAHSPGQIEMYSRAQAIARSRMDKAHRRLLEHVEGVITAFSSKSISEEKINNTQGALPNLKPAVLEEFLAAVEGVGAFCCKAQQRDMECLSLSVTAQWEVCSSVEQPQERLQALHELQEALRPLRGSYPASSPAREARPQSQPAWMQVSPRSSPTTGPRPWRSEEQAQVTSQRPADHSLSETHVQGEEQLRSLEASRSPESVVTRTAHAREEETSPQEEETSAWEAHSSYGDARRAFQQQLQVNSERVGTELPPGPCYSADSLKTHLHELQALKQQTEALWFEFELQSSLHMEENCRVEADRRQLLQQWRGQRICLQTRMKSLENALELLEPVDSRIKLISDQLDNIAKKPLDITGFALTDPSLHDYIKHLDECVQRESQLLSERKASDAARVSEADLQVSLFEQQVLQSCVLRLDQMSLHLERARTALTALEQLLTSLQQLDREISASATPPPGAAGTAPGVSAAQSIRRRLEQALEDGAQLDRLLAHAEMTVTLDSRPGSCRDLASALGKRAGREGSARQTGPRGGTLRGEGEGQKDWMLKRRCRALLATLREVQGALERQSLKEATLPAVQHRLRCLADVESKLTALRSDIQSVRESSAQTSMVETAELEEQWEEVHRGASESREELQALAAVLRRFQGCRRQLGSTLQRAEQTLGERASYMGKDNLQCLCTRVRGIKSELTSLGDVVEEFRTVCRQLRCQLRKIPDCRDAPFESEADDFMDRWLDVSEKTDCCLDDLEVGLSLWDKLLLLAGEVEAWTSHKLLLFAQSCPFQTEQDITAIEEELSSQEENVERFHCRSAEIQKLLQSTEHPLELQVIESQLKKRLGEVKELFSEASDVFRELVAAKTQVAARIAECLSSTQTIRDALNTLTALEGPQLIQNIQSLSEQLQTESERADVMLQQVALLASVASPESLLTLAKDGARLHDSISTAQEMIMLRRDQASGLSKSHQDEGDHLIEAKDLHPQDSTGQGQDPAPKTPEPGNVDSQPREPSSPHGAEPPRQATPEHEDVLEELQDFSSLAQGIGAQISELQQQVVTLGPGTQEWQDKTTERLKGLQEVLHQKADGDSCLEELKVKGQELLQSHGLDERVRQDVLHTLNDAERQWGEPHRLLQDVMESAPSCPIQRQQVESRLQQLQEQTTGLPTPFPRPGLAESQGAAEQARGLPERAKAVDSEVTVLAVRMREHAELTHDPSCPEVTGVSLENRTTSLLKQLMNVCGALELDGGREEQCSLLLKQCRETLTGLHGDVSVGSPTTQALEQEVMDIEALAATLLPSCTPEGQKELSLIIQSLHSKKTTLEESLYKQHGHQKAGEGRSEMAVKRMDVCKDVGDAKITPKQVSEGEVDDVPSSSLAERPTTGERDLSECGEHSRLSGLPTGTGTSMSRNHYSAQYSLNCGSTAQPPNPVFTIVMDTDLSMTNQASVLDCEDEGSVLDCADQGSVLDCADQCSVLDCVDQGSVLDCADQGSVLDCADQGSVLDCADQGSVLDSGFTLMDGRVPKDISHSTDVSAGQKRPPSSDHEAAPKKVAPIILDTDLPLSSGHIETTLSHRDENTRRESEMSHGLEPESAEMCKSEVDIFTQRSDPSMYGNSSMPYTKNNNQSTSESTKLYTIIVDDDPITLKDDGRQSVESPAAGHESSAGNSAVYADTTKSMDSESERACNLEQSSHCLDRINLSLLTDSVQPRQLNDAFQGQPPTGAQSSTQYTDVPESSRRHPASHQATIISRLEPEEDLPQAQQASKTSEHDGRSVSCDIFVASQETVIPNGRKTNGPDSEVDDNKCTELSDAGTRREKVEGVLDSNQKISVEKEMTAASDSKHTSTASCLHLQAISARTPDTTDIAQHVSMGLSQQEPKGFLTEGSMQRESTGTTLLETFLQVEKTDNQPKDTSTVMTASHSSVTSKCPLDIKSKDAECIIPENIPSTGAMETSERVRAESQISTRVPSQLHFSYQTESSEEQGDGLDCTTCLQSEETPKAQLNVYRIGRAQSGSVKDRIMETNGAGEQPAITSGWAILLDISTNVQPLTDTSDASTLSEKQTREAPWFLKPLPTDSEIQLEQTILRILGCRYQPAQLSKELMMKQLQEAESYRQHVAAQAAAQSQRLDGTQPPSGGCVDDRLSAVLHTATTTVKVKETQLQHVMQYHQQTQDVQDALQGLHAELHALSLDSLRSSAIQAEKLSVFLKNMEGRKGMLDALLCSCRQVTVNLEGAEGPVSCLIQVQNLQEKWHLLEGSADRALRHADICIAEASALQKDAEVLLWQLEALPTVTHSTLEKTLTFADLTEMNERYLYLLELSKALSHCPLGDRERQDIEQSFTNLKTKLQCTREKLGTDSSCFSDQLLAEVTEVLKDYFTWVKVAESRVTRRQKLSLFPEEAAQQINSMKKLQAEISLRRSKFASVVEKLKEETADLNEGISSMILSALETVDVSYSKIKEKSDTAFLELNQMLHARQRLESELTDNSTWLASLLQEQSNKGAAVKLGTTIAGLKEALETHKESLKEAERRVTIIHTLLNETKDMILSISIPESFLLIDKLTSLQAEIRGIVRREKTLCWELEDLIHAQECSADEFAAIQKSLRQIKTDLERQRYPVSQEALSAFDLVRHRLMEHLSQVQAVQHCQDHQRKDLLNTILTLQGRARILDQQAREHEKYLSSMQRLDKYIQAIRKRLPQVSDVRFKDAERFRLCHALLVELPVVKLFCQETADQLEAISDDLYPTQLASERQKIRGVVPSLAAWEQIVSNEVKELEHSLVGSVSSPSELSAVTQHFLRAEGQLKQSNCLEPTEHAITAEVRKCWTLERTVASGVRMLEACKDYATTEDYKETTDTWRRILKECKMNKEKLLHAMEALKDYQWAVQGAQGSLQQAEFRLLIPSASFKDRTEELHHTQQSLISLSQGFQAHMSEIQDQLLRQSSLSGHHVEKLHIQVFSNLLVADAILGARTRLKLKALERCLMEQSTHSKHHDEMNQLLRNVDSKLWEMLSHKSISSEDCQDQLQKIKDLLEELEKIGRKLKELRERCLVQGCSVGADQALGCLWRHWAMLQHRVDALKSRIMHTETQWKEIMLRSKRSQEALDRLQGELPDPSDARGSLGKLQGVLTQTEHLQDGLAQEHIIVISLQHCASRLLEGSSLQKLSSPTQPSQDLQALQTHCLSLIEGSTELRRGVLTEIQEWGRLQEELKSVQQSILHLLSVLQTQTNPAHLQEVREEVGSQNARLQDIMTKVRSRSSDVPQEIQRLEEEITRSLQKVKEKVGQVMERSGPLHRMTEHVSEVTVGLSCVEALLQQKSSSVREAENTLKRVWDELDQWHSRIAELEAEVQELAAEQPERAHVLMDELTKPLERYQAVAKQAEQRTAFISRIPICLQEFEDVLHSCTCWLAEAQSWLETPRTYTAATCLHSHANSLQVMLDESEGVQHTLESLRPALQDISAVCDTSTQEQKLLLVNTNIKEVRHRALEPLSHLQTAAAEMDAIEAEVNAMEMNVSKIKTILSSMDTRDIPLEEHLLNRQIILDNLQAMKRTVCEIERCRAGLGLPVGAEHSLSAFPRAQHLQQPLHELQLQTEEQSTALRVAIGCPVDFMYPYDQMSDGSLVLPTYEDKMVPVDTPHHDEEDSDDYEDEGSCSSSSETLTCSVPEDPDEALMKEERTEPDAPTVVQVSVIKESAPRETRSMESVPLKSETEPGNEDRESVSEEHMVSVSEENRESVSEENRESVSEEHREYVSDENRESVSDEHRESVSDEHRESVSDEHRESVSDEHRESVSDEHRESVSDEHRESVSEMAVQPLETLVPETAESASQLFVPSERSVNKTKEVCEDIRHTVVMHEPQRETLEAALEPAVPWSSTVKPDLVAPDVEVISTGTQPNLQGPVTGCLEEERSICRPTGEGAGGAKTQAEVPQATSPGSGVEEIAGSTLMLYHPDTSHQEHTGLQEVRSELREQRDLIEAIGRHGYDPALVQEEPTLSGMHAGYSGASYSDPAAQASSQGWIPLLSTLQTLLDSVNTEQDTTSEVRGRAEDGLEDAAGSCLVQDLRGHTERLRCLHHTTHNMDALTAVESWDAVQSELCEALTGLSHTLSCLTHVLWLPANSSQEASPLQLLILQSLSAQLAAVAAETSSLDSDFAALPGPVACDASACLERLRSCVSSVRGTLACREEKLSVLLGHSPQLQTAGQLLESPVSVLETRAAQPSDSSRPGQDPSSDQSVWGSTWCSLQGLQETSEEDPALRRCSQTLLQGLEILAGLGSERLLRARSTTPLSCHQLQSLLSQHKRYFQELKTYQAMMAHLFERLPEGSLLGHEDIDQSVSDILLQAQEQGVHMQYNLQEWCQYEELKERLSRSLEELDAALPSEDLQSEMELHPDDHLHDVQWVRGLLEDCRPQVEMLQDWASALQDTPCWAWERDSQAAPGAGLQVYWQSLHRRLERQVQRTEAMRVNYDRFQCSSTELEAWMSTARAHVQTWTSLGGSTSRDARVLLPQLMGFVQQLESKAAQKAAAVWAGTHVLHLSPCGAPALRERLARIEEGWTELTNTLPSVQHTLQQLLTGLAHAEVMAELTSWLEHMEGRLTEEERSGQEQRLLDSSGLALILQRLKDAKAEMTSWQPCLDFLNQSIEQVGSEDNSANRNERLLCAEQLGALNRRWALLLGKIESQIHEMEYRRQACAEREERLHQLRSWISKLEEKIRDVERPGGRTQIQQALEDCKRDEEMLRLKSAELLLLSEPEGGEQAGDGGSSTQLTSDQCQALGQQLSAVQVCLAELEEHWTQWDSALRTAVLGTASVAYKLQSAKGPLFSLQQSRDHAKQLQKLQVEMATSEETWTSLTGLCSDLSGRIHPGTALLLAAQLDGEKARRTATVQEVGTQLEKAQAALRLWEGYEQLQGFCFGQVRSLWEQYAMVLSGPVRQQGEAVLHRRLNAINLLEDKMEALQSSAREACEASKLLIGQMEPKAATLIQSETRLLSRDLVHLSQALARRRQRLQEDLEEHATFSHDLKSLEQCFQSSQGLMTSPTASVECLKVGLLELSSLTPELGALNEQGFRTAIAVCEAERLRALNTRWVRLFSQTADSHREMYSKQLCAQSFQQKCQAWMALLEKLEAGLCNSISGDCTFIREQLATHQKLKLEVLAGQQLLEAVVSEALVLLEKGPAEDRGDLVLRLTRLRERWQGTLRTVQHRSRCLEQLAQQWRLYSTGLKRLRHLLGDLDPILPPAGLALCSLQQLQQSMQDYERAQELLGSHGQSYTQTVKAGRHVSSWASPQARSELEKELRAFQETWEQSWSLLERRKALVEKVIHNWSSCEAGLADKAIKLKEISVRLKEPLPDNPELQEKLFKEDEDSLERWAAGLKELATMKADVSQYVLPRDVVLLQEQLDELHSQWEEVCLKVSVRKQEIADRLNAWILFNDKNKELCEWLSHMEHKVAPSSEHLSIEEMVEKLKKDCVEEINLFSENKRHLKQLSEQLLLAGDQAKEAEIHNALCHVDQRWQHLFDHIEARLNKLKETLVTVQQLHKNMSNLQSWLSRVETELSKPVDYSVCQRDEIQSKLTEQQELQRDIEQHTEGVTSILALCDVLLHDEDACSSNSENDLIQVTARTLDQRWRKICSTSLEKRKRTVETWQLWCQFQDDCSRFEDWLNTAERSASEPSSSDVPYAVAKDELRRYEALQRELHERLTQLESINHQYCLLARENRLDAGCMLRTMVQRGNQQWDALQKRVAAILRRLRHFTAQREEFEATRERLLLWLTDMDLQLSSVEHFSESDIHHKLDQLSGLKKEITLNTNQIDTLIVFGEGLIQRSSPLDAALIEDELEELHSYCQGVFRRAALFHQRLTSPRPRLQEELELPGPSEDASDQAPTCPVPPPQECSGRETPISVDSIPLEWDHTGDVGGSSSHEEDEGASFFTGTSGVEVTENPEAFVKSTVQALETHSGQGMMVAQDWLNQTAPEDKALSLNLLEHPRAVHTSTPDKHVYVLSEDGGSIKSGKRVSLLLDDGEQQMEQGLTALTVADKQSGVIERWELLQAQAMNQRSRHPQQLISHLHDVTSWLGRVTPELETLLSAEEPETLEHVEAQVKQLKEIQKAFARYKTLMLSLNLGSGELQLEAGAADLCGMNRAWAAACSSLEAWETRLRTALLQCQEFNETLHSALLWLAHAEDKRYNVNIHEPTVPLSTLHEHRTALAGLEEELKGKQRQVGSLQELASELLPESGPDDSAEAREKVHVIGSKLRLLLRQVKQDLQTIQERLESSDAASMRTESGVSSMDPAAEAGAEGRHGPSFRVERRETSPQRSFFYRVLRAAFPLHLLVLLLLVLACLVPLSEEDYSCTLTNNFARSFYPMLRYTNGPPPT